MPSLAEFQNPYASLNINERVEDELAKHDYVARLQNPYAALEVFGEADADAVTVPGREQLELPTLRKETSLSKEEFKARARAIFLQYEPMRGNRRLLRPSFRDFIKSNETKSGRVRAEILKDLERFDLSAMGALNPQLNREGDSISRKLGKISQKYSAEN
jgi:hypothetical protein